MRKDVSTSEIAQSQLGLDFTGDSVAAAPAGARSSSKPATSKPATKTKSSEGESTKETSRTRRSRKPGLSKKKPPGQRATAKEMATRQRAISISEFFSKNRHLLGFDNPSKALLTTVKEGVDNALDACEEAGILPEVTVEIRPAGEEDRFQVAITDNGPGILRTQVPKIFGSLLYGSKFHVLKQSRGQQGIGISAAGMYGLLTTGKPIRITSRTSRRKPAHHFELVMDTRTNEPQILVDEEVDWDLEHGTRVEITLQGTYKKGRHSVDGYLRQVAIANPHASIRYIAPDAATDDQPIIYERVAGELPPEPVEIRPHPYGVELGLLLKMFKETKARNLASFLQSEFSRVSARVAGQILEAADLKPNTRPARLANKEAERLHAAMNQVRIMAPPTNCITPIGEDLLLRTLQQDVEAEFFSSVTRPPAVYRGNPFQIEVGLAYGGNLSAEDLVTLYRFANRVPLQYQQSACAMTKSVLTTDWKKYHLSQSRGALPAGPMVLAVHIASVWVPFTSESKEAVAHYPEIIKELRLALQEAGRRLGTHIRRRRRDAEEFKKRSYIQKYIPHIGFALQDILGFTDEDREKTVEVLTDTLERSRTK